MHIVVSMLANRAEVGQDGLLYVQGGGWEHVTVPAVPSNVEGYFAGLAEFQEAEIGSAVPIEMRLTDQLGNDGLWTGSMLVSSSRRLAPFAVHFLAMLTTPGPTRFEVSDAEGVLSVVEFDFRVSEPD